MDHTTILFVSVLITVLFLLKGEIRLYAPNFSLVLLEKRGPEDSIEMKHIEPE